MFGRRGSPGSPQATIRAIMAQGHPLIPSRALPHNRAIPPDVLSGVAHQLPGPPTPPRIPPDILQRLQSLAQNFGQMQAHAGGPGFSNPGAIHQAAGGFFDPGPIHSQLGGFAAPDIPQLPQFQPQQYAGNPFQPITRDMVQGFFDWQQPSNPLQNFQPQFTDTFRPLGQRPNRARGPY